MFSDSSKLFEDILGQLVAYSWMKETVVDKYRLQIRMKSLDNVKIVEDKVKLLEMIHKLKDCYLLIVKDGRVYITCTGTSVVEYVRMDEKELDGFNHHAGKEVFRSEEILSNNDLMLYLPDNSNAISAVNTIFNYYLLKNNGLVN